MATQILDTELGIARKYLHFSQRDLYMARYRLGMETLANPIYFRGMLAKIKYWRTRYNAAMAIEQTRVEENYFNWIED